MPVDPDACGSQALKTLPTIEQVFVNAGSDLDEATFNRKLYLARRRARSTWRAATRFLHSVALGQHHRLQGHGDAAVPGAVLSGPQGSADGSLGGGVPPALFDQHLPQWRLAHPYRYLAHNGEINTIEGNRSWAVARGPLFRSPVLPDLGDILPLVSLTGSDSQSLDNMLELLLMGGLDPMHAHAHADAAGLAVGGHDRSRPAAFYEYYATHMEPWDGPAGIVLTDGRYAGCTLDRNGLRPARWVITKNRHLTIASEIGRVGLPARGCGAQGQAGAGRDAGARPADRRAAGHQATSTIC
jgi:glutamate synthase (NADPH/NADH) large chain